MVRKGTRGRDGEVDWTCVGTTLSRANAMVESVGVQRSTFKLPHSRLGGRWLKTVPNVPWMQIVAAGIESCLSHGVDRHHLSISISVQYLKCKLLLVLHLGKRRRISLIRPTIRYYNTSFWSQILGVVDAEMLSHLLAFCTGRRPCQTVMMYRQR